MVIFDLWGESFILIGLCFLSIAIPCFFLAQIGRKIIYQLGHYPTKTALILKSFDFVKYILVGSLAIILFSVILLVLGD